MRNKKMATRNIVAITAFGLIVSGTGILGVTMTKAEQKSIKSEVRNDEVASNYQKESDSTKKIKVKVKENEYACFSREDDGDIVVEIPEEGQIVYQNDEGELDCEIASDAGEIEYFDFEKESIQEKKMKTEKQSGKERKEKDSQ